MKTPYLTQLQRSCPRNASLAIHSTGGTIDRVTTDSPYNEARCIGASLYYSTAAQNSGGDTSRIAMSPFINTSVAKVSNFKVSKVNKVAIFYGIVLIPLLLLSMNTFNISTMRSNVNSVTAGQSELNEARI